MQYWGLRLAVLGVERGGIRGLREAVLGCWGRRYWGVERSGIGVLGEAVLGG